MHKALHLFLLPILAVLVAPSLFAQGSPNVTLLAHIDDYSTYNDCWGYIAPDGREYALLGVTTGTSIIDITDAPTVNEIDFIPSQNSSWKDIKTYRHYAYAVNESGGGLQIMDLSDLPNSVTLLPAYTGFTTSHNIYIDTANAMLYAEGSFGSQSVRVISLADPENPVQLTTFGVECHDVYVHSNRAYVAEGYQGTIGVYDVTNPASPTLLKRIGIPASGYVHNCWTTEDGNYLMSTEETTGKTIKMWDITDLDNPTIVDTYLGPTQLAHNVHIEGDFAYISHYADGLRIVDISNPNNISEVGYYDTYPGGGGGFVGAWGSFPHFTSGKRLVSDISTGLYVVYFDDGGMGGTGIPCDSIDQFQARCVSGGTIQARVVLLNSTQYAGEEVTIAIDEVEYSATVVTNGTHSRASFSVGGHSSGDHTLALVSPSCANFPPMVISCPATGSSGEELPWGDSEWLAGGAEQGGSTVIPTTTRLNGNYPNPFNPTTTITYDIAHDEWVSLKVYNTLGQEIATLVNGYQTPGSRSVVWNGRRDDGTPVSSGIYVYRLTAGNVVQTQKMILTK
jgi:choice-of-anchor B domain-containing protein